MQPVPYATIQATPTKQSIQAVSGTVTQVFQRETKMGNHGPYTMQKLLIQEPGTNQVLRATIFDADPFNPSQIGQTFSATLGQNSKGQWVGLAADHYQSQTQGMIYGVRCGKGGNLYLNGLPCPAGGSPPPQPQFPPPQPQFPPQAQGYSPQPVQPAYQPPPQPVQAFVPQMGTPPPQVQIAAKTPTSFLAGQSAAYAMCFDAALKVREQVQSQLELGPGEPLSTTDVKDVATTFFIEGNRRGIFNSVVGNVYEESTDQP